MYGNDPTVVCSLSWQLYPKRFMLGLKSRDVFDSFNFGRRSLSKRPWYLHQFQYTGVTAVGQSSWSKLPLSVKLFANPQHIFGTVIGQHSEALLAIAHLINQREAYGNLEGKIKIFPGSKYRKTTGNNNRRVFPSNMEKEANLCQLQYEASFI